MHVPLLDSFENYRHQFTIVGEPSTVEDHAADLMSASNHAESYANRFETIDFSHFRGQAGARLAQRVNTNTAAQLKELGDKLEDTALAVRFYASRFGNAQKEMDQLREVAQANHRATNINAENANASARAFEIASATGNAAAMASAETAYLIHHAAYQETHAMWLVNKKSAEMLKERLKSDTEEAKQKILAIDRHIAKHAVDATSDFNGVTMDPAALEEAEDTVRQLAKGFADDITPLFLQDMVVDADSGYIFEAAAESAGSQWQKIVADLSEETSNLSTRMGTIREKYTDTENLNAEDFNKRADTLLGAVSTGYSGTSAALNAVDVSTEAATYGAGISSGAAPFAVAGTSAGLSAVGAAIGTANDVNQGFSVGESVASNAAGIAPSVAVAALSLAPRVGVALLAPQIAIPVFVATTVGGAMLNSGTKEFLMDKGWFS